MQKFLVAFLLVIAWLGFGDINKAQAAVAYRSSAATCNATANTSVSVPGGTVNGDVMILLINSKDNAVQATPSGWTRIGSQLNNTTSLTTNIFYRVANSEPASYSPVTTAVSHCLTISSFSGVSNLAPVNTSSQRANSSSLTITADAVTPSIANSELIFISGYGDDVTHASYSGTNPTFSERFDAGTIDGTDSAVALASGIKTDTTSSGSRTATASGTAAVNNGFLVALTPAVNVNISGICKQTDGTTDCSDTGTIKIAINGALQAQTQTTVGGTWTVSGLTQPTSGDVITVFVDGAASSSQRAVAVTTYDGSGDVTGLELIEGALSIGNSDNRSISNTNLSLYDNSVSGDADIFHDVSSSNLTVDSNSSITNETLYIKSGNTFAPGGNITTASYKNLGTFTAGSNLISFTAASGTPVLAGSLDGVNSFYKVNFDTGSTGTAEWTIQSPMKVSAANATDAFVIKYGTVTLGDNSGDNLQVAGKIVIAGTAGEIGTFRTLPLASGSITIDLNANTSTPGCANCIISIGATSGSGQGNFKIAKNTILRLNPASSGLTPSDTGIEVESTGYLEILGSQEATHTITSLTQSTSSTTITVSGAAWTTGQFDNMHARLSSGKIFAISNTTSNTIQLNAVTSSTDTDPDVVGAVSCTGNGTCTINVADNLITATGQHVGNYLHNKTDDKYYLIVTTTEAATDSIGILSNVPDVFTTMGDGDDLEITEGIRVGDIFQIIDYAHVTAEAGTACSSTVNQSGEAYIHAKAGSESLIRYADICNLGRGAAGKFGLYFDTVNGANSLEGATIDTSRVQKGLRGALFVNSSGNKGSEGIMNNSFENNTDVGIYLSGSSDNAIINNLSFNNDIGILLETTSNINTIESNKFYRNVSHGVALTSSSRNKITGNSVYYNGTTTGTHHGLYISSNSKNNVIDSNHVFNNISSGIVVNSSNTTISNNISHNNKASGIVVEQPYNSLFSNASFNNITNGLTLVCSTADDPTTVLFSNNFYLNQSVGLKLESGYDCSATSINDNYGGFGINAVADLGMGNGGAPTPGDHRLALLNPTLSSTTSTSFSEVANVNSYAISRKHNGVSGGTAVWGKYVVPSNDSETPQNESVVKFNYADNLWEKSASHHGYSGTGTEDTNLDYDLSTATLSGGPYHYRLTVKTGGNCAAAVFDVYRSNVDIGDATCGTQFTDSTTTVKFKVDGGGTAYVIGDSYTFNVWDASSNTNVQKSITMMEDKGTFSVPTGATLELKGQSAGTNVTFITRGATGGYQFAISGTIDANAYQYDYLGGTDQTAGLVLNSGATVTSLSNGSYNNQTGTAPVKKITYSSRPSGTDHIYIMNEDGTGVTQLTNTAYNDRTPEWSNDGTKIVFNRTNDGEAIYKMDANGSNVTRLSGSAAGDLLPGWSHDGTKIVYTKIITPGTGPSDTVSTINIMDSDGTDVVELFDNNSFNMAPRMSPDGTKIVFACGPFNGFVQICIMDSDGTDMVQLTDVANSNHGDPHWSYDGSKISFGSTRESGDDSLDVYIMDADGTDVVMLADFDFPDEGGDIGWSQDGKRLAFQWDDDGGYQSNPNADAEIWMVNVDGTGLVSTGQHCSGVGCSPRWQPNTSLLQPTNFDFIQVNSSLIGSGTPQKTISGLKFENVKGSANCNLNVIGTVTGYWELTSWTGSFSGEAYDCKNGSADLSPGNFKWTP